VKYGSADYRSFDPTGNGKFFKGEYSYPGKVEIL